MKVLAIDYGLARTGLAVSDATGTIATPLEFLPSRDGNKLFSALLDVINAIKPDKIIMGLPVRTDMRESEMSERVKLFAARVKEASGIEPELKSEMFTTVIASKRLHENEKNAKKQRSLIDSAAAAVLLQDYLDANNR